MTFTIPGFKIHQPPLGAGNFGTTYRADRQSDKITICLKISKVVIKQEDKDELEKEVLAHSNLNHTNIIKYISHFWQDSSLVIEMELADGGNLSSIIQKDMHEDQILFYFVQIVDAIEYIHDKNIIHRDLKPDNIFIMKNGQIKTW